MKTISLETSKKLQPYLKDIETKKVYICHSDGYDLEDYNHYWPWDIKTLDVEEAIEFLPDVIDEDGVLKSLGISKTAIYYEIYYSNNNLHNNTSIYIDEPELIEALDKMINHLIDNNLL